MGDQDRLQELRGELRELQTLQEHSGWKLLLRYAAAQKEGRINDLLLKTDTKTKEVHYTRGELAGIKLFCEIPGIEVDRIKGEIEEIVKKVEESEDENVEPDSES